MSAIIRHFEESDIPEIREIFFESSAKKDFKDEFEKEFFFEKYLGFYLRRFPRFAFVAFEHKVLGYVVGAPYSLDEELLELQPHMNTFQGYFNKFPSHLHINCHFEARGQGIGRNLIATFEQELKNLHIKGLHIMTSPDAVNKKFYSSLGFHDHILEDFNGSSILFMGKVLMEE